MKVSFVTLKDCSINKPIKLKIDELKQHFAAKGLFEGIGCSKTTVAKLKIKENAEWNIQKCRPIPLAIKPGVELEINRLIDENIIEQTEDEKFACPIVIVAKRNNELRICGEFRPINLILEDFEFSIPKINELISSVEKPINYIARLDLANAFH